MDSSLDELVAQGKGRIDRPRKNNPGRKQHTPNKEPREEKGEKEDAPRLQAALKGMDVLNSSLEDIIAVERSSGKGNRKGGKSKGKGGKGSRKGNDMLDRPLVEYRPKGGKGKGGFQRNSNYGGNFNGGGVAEWDFTIPAGHGTHAYQQHYQHHASPPYPSQQQNFAAAAYEMQQPPYQQRQDAPDHRGRSRSPPNRARQGTFGRRILVENIPRNLASKDLEEAFLEVGKVQDVEVDGGKAWVVFSSPKEAYEAEHRYDGGQINHQIIRVSVQ